MPSLCRLTVRTAHPLASNVQGSCHGFAETPPARNSQRYVTLTLPLLRLLLASAFPAERKTTQSKSQVPYTSVTFNGFHSPVWSSVVQCVLVWSSVARYPRCRISFTDIWRNFSDGGMAGRKSCTHTQKRIQATRLHMTVSQMLLKPTISVLSCIEQYKTHRARQQ
jgi:hypothetical protein